MLVESNGKNTKNIFFLNLSLQAIWLYIKKKNSISRKIYNELYGFVDSKECKQAWLIFFLVVITKVCLNVNI